MNVTIHFPRIARNIVIIPFVIFLTAHTCAHAHVGFLGTVTDFTGYQTKADEITYAWSPPYTIDGVPILGYESDILILDEWNASLIYAYHEFVNDVFLVVLKPEPGNNCVYVNISVRAVNSVGQGQSVHNIFYFSEGIYSYKYRYIQVYTLFIQKYHPA